MGLIDLGWVAHQAKAHCQKLTTKRPQKNGLPYKKAHMSRRDEKKVKKKNKKKSNGQIQLTTLLYH